MDGEGGRHTSCVGGSVGVYGGTVALFWGGADGTLLTVVWGLSGSGGRCEGLAVKGRVSGRGGLGG